MTTLDGGRSEFRAPFSRLLGWISALTTLLLVSVVVVGLAALPARGPIPVRSLVLILPVLLLGGAVSFSVRGYRIESGKLRINRLGWHTEVDLGALVSVHADPGAMKRSLRLLGNGGLFSFTGLFWNRPLGTYRAFVTDPARAVVLRIGTRTIVVSPDAPDEFVQALRSKAVRTAPHPPSV